MTIDKNEDAEPEIIELIEKVEHEIAEEDMNDNFDEKTLSFYENICINWDKPDAERPSAGKGVAFRIQPNEHYAEVKTQGYSSNTTVTIVHNDASASELIGAGGGGGNTVYIKQNLGVLRR